MGWMDGWMDGWRWIDGRWKDGSLRVSQSEISFHTVGPVSSAPCEKSIY